MSPGPGGRQTQGRNFNLKIGAGAKDPANLAGMVAQHIIQGEVRNAQWHENLKPNPDNTIFLDVRDTEEREEDGFVPGSVHIPLAELRTRSSDLPKDNEIIV